MCLNSSWHPHPGLSPFLVEIPTPAQSHVGLGGPQGGMGAQIPNSQLFPSFLTLSFLTSSAIWGFPSVLATDPPRVPEQVPASRITCLLNFYVALEGRAIWKLN